MAGSFGRASQAERGIEPRAIGGGGFGRVANVYEGQFAVSGQRFGIVVARFNDFITERLLAGALDALRRHGVRDEDVDVAWVPGAFEIPLVARRLARSGRYAAVVTLGAVIRGATAHFDYVAGNVASGVARVALDADVPVIFGVLTTDTIEQAIERAGTKAGNKGFEAALVALEMASLLGRLPAAAATGAEAARPARPTDGAASGRVEAARFVVAGPGERPTEGHWRPRDAHDVPGRAAREAEVGSSPEVPVEGHAPRRG